jgi:hypothetical protein
MILLTLFQTVPKITVKFYKLGTCHITFYPIFFY